MAGLFSFLPLILKQRFSSQQSFQRIPEQSPVSNETDQVNEYNQVLSSPLVLTYAMVLKQISRLTQGSHLHNVLDVGCGPGHLSLLLALQNAKAKVTGIDLAPKMIRTAILNSLEMDQKDRCHFQVEDALKLISLSENKYDLVTSTNFLHQLPELSMVRTAIAKMESKTSPQGHIVIGDLLRLKTPELTAKYVEIVGKSLLADNRHAFYEDFRQSQSAAWTAEELQAALPENTGRIWVQIIPFGLPTSIIMIGLPVGQKTAPKLSLTKDWADDLIPPAYLGEWSAFKLSFRLAKEIVHFFN